MRIMNRYAAIIVVGAFGIAAAATPAAAHHARIGGARTVPSHSFAANWHRGTGRGHDWRAATVRHGGYWGSDYASTYASSEYGGFYPNVARRAWGGASSCTCGAW
jgi:hypothetical protein